MSADHWFDLFADGIEMRSVLAPELPDDLAAHRGQQGGGDGIFRRRSAATGR